MAYYNTGRVKINEYLMYDSLRYCSEVLRGWKDRDGDMNPAAIACN